ncbi:hypothetical protein [Maribacter sp. HTCC2170]|uniref:hypothetical protein n=1 Tax=Maribacter sp. (strain HTCC2170 / KCCM 42371) TaxID=313603 RepID=UPI00006B483F|nr:hypothetical protein [Maribacter sp. HTCC2170]EAR01960.1 hypothetical protein FB2170_15568 [Maribacter sp. HTCC2170]
MENHFELSDSVFEQQFESCELDSKLFSHEAHLRLAYIHIKKYREEKAIENVCKQLVAYVNHLGATDKYNTTLTVAAVKAVYHFMQKSKSNDFKGFIVEFSQLKFEFRRLMECHYGFDIFNSPAAKSTFLEPDLVPFD